MGVSSQLHASVALLPAKGDLVINWIAKWVGPIAVASGNKNQVPIEWEAGWAPEPVAKSLLLQLGIEPLFLDPTTRYLSLYQLGYLGSIVSG
jgi:hypothetical protein